MRDQQPFTTVIPIRGKGAIVLSGIWRLEAITKYVKMLGGDVLNFQFTRHHPSGRKQSFIVTNGELTEITPEGKKSSNITLQH